jgi:hypothetical protein
MIRPPGLADLHMDPPDPVPYVSEHALLGPLPSNAVDELLAVVGPGSGSPLVSVELRHSGGALARAADGHGAVASLPGSFVLFGVGAALDPALTAANEEQLALLEAAAAPYKAGMYFNFAEEVGSAARFFAADTYRRLQAAKAEYDPDNLFRANHPIEQDAS